MSWITHRHPIRLVLSCLPALVFNPHRRKQFAEMRTFCRRLPLALQGPLPDALARLTPEVAAPQPAEEDRLRKLTDLAAQLEAKSPLGLCLRRSLTRYYFLRQVGAPLAVHFGARFNETGPDRDILGHAWLTRDGQPYYEREADYIGFTVMFSWPPDDRQREPPAGA